MRLGAPDRWLLSTVGQSCAIRNDLRLPISKELRATMGGQFPYFGPTGMLDRLSSYRLEGTFALIGEDGDHFLDVDNKQQTLLVTGRFNVNNHAHVIASTDNCDAEWFFNYFRNRSLKSSLTRQGAGRYKLNKAALEKLPLLVPPREEQAAINFVIRVWDSAIEKAELLVAAVERRHRALLIRLLGPRLWNSARHARADVLFEVSSKRGRPDLPVLAVTQDQGVVPRSYLDRRIAMDLSDPATFKVVSVDDFVISLRSFQGGLEHSAYDGLVSPAYTVLRRREGVEANFYRHYLKSPDFLKRLSVAVVGIRDGKQINFADFASIKLPLTSLDQQRSVAAVLDESEGEIVVLRRQSQLLRAQRRGLMQKLLTGEWRLPLPEPEAI